MRALIACASALLATVAAAAPGLPVGTPFPKVEALDQSGATRDFESLKGKNGLLYIFSRSSDW